MVNNKKDKYEAYKARKNINSAESSIAASFGNEEGKKNYINATIDSQSPDVYK